MAERDAGHDRDKSRGEPEEQASQGQASQGQSQAPQDQPRDELPPEPLDEDAAWAAIVAGYGEEPADPPGARPFRSIEDLAELVEEATGSGDASDGGSSRDGTPPKADAGPKGDGSKDDEPKGAGTDQGAGKGSGAGAGAGKSLGGSIVFAPGVGPRDYRPSEGSEDDFDQDDEGHFVPPEPPPLPEADVTAKFAWLAVIGGPLLLLLAVLLGWDMTWWLTTLGIGGFIGGFATLVLRMQGDDDEDDDPGRGAVV